MGRLLSLGFVAGAIGALAGGIAGASLLKATAPLPEERLWFVGICAALIGSGAALAAMVVERMRGTGGARLRYTAASVLIGGCAGALAAQRQFGTAPRGKQLIYFAVGALAAGCAAALIHRLRRSAEAPPPKPRGRWFQFTLGSLLAVMVLASIAMALWVRGPIKRREVSMAIERGGGGHVGYASRAPGWVADLLGDFAGVYDEVSEIELRNAVDADVEKIAVFSRLKSLSLRGSVTDKAMKIVARYTFLETLELQSAGITSKGLAELRRLPRLREFRVRYPIDDAGLR